MQIAKRVISVILCFAFMSGVFLAGNTSASAEDSNYYTFGISDEYAMIIKCSDKAAGEIIIPDQVGGLPVKIIGNEAFKNCDKITKIILPECIMGINNHAFSGCTGLQNVELNSGLSYIGDYAFSECNSLKSVMLPAAIQQIGSGVFANCSSLETIAIDGENDSYEVSGNCLVYTPGRTLLAGTSSSTIPSDGRVTVINNYAFCGCSNLDSLTIPDSITAIGAYAFYGCKKIVSVSIPTGVLNIGPRAFSECDSLSRLTVSDNNANYKSSNNCIIDKRNDSVAVGCKTSVIPADGSVTAIAGNSFYGCAGLEQIEIPDCITTIGNDAFANCCDVKSVNLGKGVSSIGFRAFSFCEKLEEIAISPLNDKFVSEGNCVIKNDSPEVVLGCKTSEIPQNPEITTIGDYAFFGCLGLKNISIPLNIKELNKYSFSECKDLQNVILRGRIEKINDGVFRNCGALSSISLPYGLKSIGYNAFEGCGSLAIINVPGSVTEIGDGAFAACSALETINLPSGLPKLSSNLFLNCKKLSEITIPSSVTFIGSNTFGGCSSLGNITLPSGLRNIGVYAFSGCNSLSRIVLPDSVESVGANAFEFCQSLRSAKISDKITDISYREFYGCTSLKEITFSESVIMINSDAFKGCSSLKNVFYSGTQSDKEKISIMSGNSEIINAVWNCSSELFTLTYNANGGKNAPVGQTGNGEITLSYSVPSRTEYTFLGWADSGSAQTAQYQPGDTFNLLANAIVYAIWKKDDVPAVSYTLKYDAAGGKNAPADQTGNGTVFLSDKVPDRNGYVFEGWATEKGSSVVKYKPGKRYYLKAYSTLYAVWKISPNVKLNVPANAIVAYRTNTTLTVTAENLPDDCRIVIYEKTKEVARSKNNKSISYKMGEMTATKTLEIKVVDAEDKVLADSTGKPMSQSIKITVNTDIFSWLIAIFRSLFKIAQPMKEIK